MNAQLEPVNPTERRTAHQIQDFATRAVILALQELRRADDVRRIGSELIDAITQEMKDHREGTEALGELQTALAALQRAERLIRARGETNGH